jgi:hypothetical protein
MKYMIDHIDGTANKEYFEQFRFTEFEAETTKEAYQFVKKLQTQGEKEMREDGKELTDYDPCLYNCVAVLKGHDKDGDAIWLPVDWSCDDME